MTECLCTDIELCPANTEIEIELESGGGWKKRSKYNLTDRDWLGVPNENGTMVASTAEINPVFNGVRILNSQILREKFGGDARLKDVSFPDLVSINSDYALYRSFGNYYYWGVVGNAHTESLSFPELQSIVGNSALECVCGYTFSLKKISFPKLKTVNGTKALYRAFAESKIEGEVCFPELESITGDNAFDSSMYGANYTKISFPKLKTISGIEVFNNFAHKSQNLTDVSFPELEVVEGDNCFELSFFDCDNLKHIDFSKLRYVGNPNQDNSVFYECFNDLDSLEELVFPELEYIYDGGFYYAIMWNIKLKTLSYPKLKYIGRYGHANCWGNEALENVYFPELEEVGVRGLQSGFSSGGVFTNIEFPKLKKVNFSSFYVCFSDCPHLRDVRFPSLTKEALSVPDNNEVEPYTGYFFSEMLRNCSDVTVHFPAETEEVLYNRPYVLDGFSGTNTTILFDINCCYVHINVIGSSNYKIYVYGMEKGDTFPTSVDSKECVVYDITNSRLYSFMLTGLVIGETVDFNVDLSQCTNMNKVSTGIPNLNVDFTWNSYNMTVLEDGSGGYYFYSNTAGLVVNYVIHPTAEKRGSTGTITTTNASQTIVDIPAQREWLPLDINHMTENGVLGGETPAADSSSSWASHLAYCAFDGNVNTYWAAGYDEHQLLYLYSPDPVKLTRLDFVMDSSTTHRMNSYVLYGSNDGENYTQIFSQTVNYAQTFTSNVNSNTPYKYFKFDITKRKPGSSSYEMEVYEITCTGLAYR